MADPRSQLAHAPQIDTLRAFAVAGVLVSHAWLPDTQYGHLGVRQFFVLSGFLITAILLSYREEMTQGPSGGAALKVFFARRILRIFPAYFLLLGIVYLLDPASRGPMAWYAAYAANIHFAIENDWGTWYLAHLWSLSVEEQFYLIWPFLILFLPTRTLAFAIGLTIIAALVFRGAISGWPDGPAHWVLTPGALDALGLGACLALVVRSFGLTGKVLWALAGLAAFGGLIYYVSLRPAYWNESFYFVWAELAVLFPMVFFVAVCWAGVPGPLGLLLNTSSLRFFGKISYGIYLYHYPVMAAYFAAAELFHFTPLSHGAGLLAVVTVLTIAAASLSWFLIELPTNRLKSGFRIVPEAAKA